MLLSNFLQYVFWYFSSSLQSVISIPGHGFLITKYPFLSGVTGFPFSSTTTASIPGKEKVPEPGFIGTISMPVHAPIMMPPVSVCHHVSTIGQFSFPIVLKYHIHTSGLIGSPTVPNRRSEDKSKELGILFPNLIYIRRAVGVVYRIVAPCFSTISQYLSGFG